MTVFSGVGRAEMEAADELGFWWLVVTFFGTTSYRSKLSNAVGSLATGPGPRILEGRGSRGIKYM